MNSSQTSLDHRQFRDVLSRFATGVAIVTATVNKERIGATISSFNSVSLEPPLVLFSLASTSLRLAQWKAAKFLSIFFLGENQTGLSNRFARAGRDKWSDLKDTRSGNGSPWLPGSLASLDCIPYAIYPGGDHDIFVCEVNAFALGDGTVPPLIFYSGKYRHLKASDARGSPPPDNPWLHGW